MCHLFAEHDPEQPASAIVNFVSKVMIGSHKKWKRLTAERREWTGDQLPTPTPTTFQPKLWPTHSWSLLVHPAELTCVFCTDCTAGCRHQREPRLSCIKLKSSAGGWNYFKDASLEHFYEICIKSYTRFPEDLVRKSHFDHFSALYDLYPQTYTDCACFWQSQRTNTTHLLLIKPGEYLIFCT